MKPEPVYKTIGMVVRGLRRKLELSQDKLAARLGMSRATLASIETGRQRMLVHQLYAFAAALGLKPSDLLPPTGGISTADLTNLTIQGDVNAVQREQILRSIMMAMPGPPTEEGEKDAKGTKRVPGSARQKAAR